MQAMPVDLQSSLSIASSGLNVIEYQYAVTSNNVANSSTPGYVSETPVVCSAVSCGYGTGVTQGMTQLNISPALQKELYKQNAIVAQNTALSNSLSAISSVQGSTAAQSGQTNTLSDVLGNLRAAVSSLIDTPNQTSAQSAVISKAQAVVSVIHTLSETYATQRQTAQNTIVSTVGTINTDLTRIGLLSKQIMVMKALGEDTASLQNERYGVMNALSSLVSVKFTEKSNGDVEVTTSNGTQLPTYPGQINSTQPVITQAVDNWPLSTSKGSDLTESSYYGSSSGGTTDGTTGGTTGTIPPIKVAGANNTETDITNDLTGGTLGANITLRDETYPKMQAQLDAFSYTLIQRFQKAGLPLFTDGTTDAGGNGGQTGLPTTASGKNLLGLAGNINVSSAYAAKPESLVQGTTGSGVDLTRLDNVLGQTFSSDSQYVSGDYEAPTDNLGPTGNISTGYSGTQSLIALATSLTANQSAVIANASNNLTYSTSVQTVIQTKVDGISGVNVDDEMARVVALQNAYAANAKVISAVSTMFEYLMNAV